MLKRLTTPWTIRALLVAALAVVSLRPLSAQIPVAKVELMTGQVSILQDPNRLSSATSLFVGSQIKAQQLVVTGPSSYAKFRLEDGSYFEIFENSKVQFHEDFGLEYLLNIILGHVKVLIDHSKGPNPNSVTTPTAVISVRGTIFDIEVDDDGTTLVVLDEGWVHVRNSTAPGPERDLREPGDYVRVFRGQGLMGKQADPNGILQKIARPLEDAVRVLAQQNRLGIPIGSGAPAGGPTVAGVPGAQGDKGKGGAAPAPPPPAPPSGGH